MSLIREGKLMCHRKKTNNQQTAKKNLKEETAQSDLKIHDCTRTDASETKHFGVRSANPAEHTVYYSSLSHVAGIFPEQQHELKVSFVLSSGMSWFTLPSFLFQV